MKKNITLFVALSLASISGSVLAACPSNLSAEQMEECITKENAGYWYTPSDEQSSAQAVPVSTISSNELAVANKNSQLIRN